MIAVLYGILIAALMGASAFVGAWFAMKYKGISDIRVINMGHDEKDEEAMREMMKNIPAAGKPFNIDDEVPEGFYKRSGYSEDLKRATTASK